MIRLVFIAILISACFLCLNLIVMQVPYSRNANLIQYDSAVLEYNEADSVNIKVLALSKIRNLDFEKYGYSKKLANFHNCMLRETIDHDGAVVGGTATAIRISMKYDIPVFNLGVSDKEYVLNDIKNFLESRKE